MTGTVFGYDPGGNGKHGLARATVRDGSILNVTTETLHHVEDVVTSILNIETPLGLGIDTLTCWSTGPSGWRPADHWLRRHYRDVQNSVVAPNSLYGAMSLSGMASLVAVRQAFPDIFVTETHPKVLYYQPVQRALRLQRPENLRHEQAPESIARRRRLHLKTSTSGTPPSRFSRSSVDFIGHGGVTCTLCRPNPANVWYSRAARQPPCGPNRTAGRSSGYRPH